jgi:protein phosphatase
LKQAVEVDIRSDPAFPGDIFLLCSDGLCGVIKDKQILEIILLSNDLTDACESLIALANDAGGPDNITAVAIRLEADGIAQSGPEILISVVGEDDIPEDTNSAPAKAAPGKPAPAKATKPRNGAVCEKCGKRAVGAEVFCGACGARIAL